MKHKHGRKALARLQARRAAHDVAFGSKAGYTRPGSLNRKKSFPRGKHIAGRDHSANTWSV